MYDWKESGGSEWGTHRTKSQWDSRTHYGKRKAGSGNGRLLSLAKPNKRTDDTLECSVGGVSGER